MVGDIVTPLPYDYDTGRGRGPLASGCSRYADAVVVSVTPFILVSREGDMLWSATVKREDFIVSDRASDDLFASCQRRVRHTGRRGRRVRAKVRRRNRREFGKLRSEVKRLSGMAAA